MEIKSGALVSHQLTQTDCSDRKPPISQMDLREQGGAPHRSPKSKSLIVSYTGGPLSQC